MFPTSYVPLLELDRNGHPRQYVCHAQPIYRFLANMQHIYGQNSEEQIRIEMIDAQCEYILAEYRSQPFYGHNAGQHGENYGV